MNENEELYPESFKKKAIETRYSRFDNDSKYLEFAHDILLSDCFMIGYGKKEEFITKTFPPAHLHLDRVLDINPLKLYPELKESDVNIWILRVSCDEKKQRKIRNWKNNHWEVNIGEIMNRKEDK